VKSVIMTGVWLNRFIRHEKCYYDTYNNSLFQPIYYDKKITQLQDKRFHCMVNFFPA
jgi:hypothetical protein